MCISSNRSPRHDEVPAAVLNNFLPFLSFKDSIRERRELTWAVVVAQLVERSLLTPEVHTLNPTNDQYSTNRHLEKTKIKEKKRSGTAVI